MGAPALLVPLRPPLWRNSSGPIPAKPLPIGIVDCSLARRTAVVGRGPRRRSHTGRTRSGHCSDRFGDRVLARATAGRHVDLQRIWSRFILLTLDSQVVWLALFFCGRR